MIKNGIPPLLTVLLAAVTAVQLSADSLARGNRYYRQQDYYEAIRSYNNAIAGGQDDARLYFNRGAAYFHKEKYEKAEADFTRYLDSGERPSWRALYNRGCARLARGRRPLNKKVLRAAQTDFRAALRRAPRHEGIRKNLQITALLLRARKKEQNQQKKPAPSDKKTPRSGQSSRQPKGTDGKDSGKMGKEAVRLLLDGSRDQERDAQQERLRRQRGEQQRGKGRW